METSPKNDNNNQAFGKQLSIDDFEILKKLRKEGHSSIDQVQYKKTGKIYALKSEDKKYYDFKENEINYLREKEILYDLTKRDYPHTVKLFADFEDDNYRYLVMEFIEGTYLHELKGNIQNRGYIAQNLVINIITQLLETLEYLHDTCHIIHRNIKPDNIIIEKNNNIKLINFGLSAYIINPNKQLVYNKSLKAIRSFAAPEIILYPQPLNYDYKIDVFSLGFTIYSLMNPCEEKNYNLPLETHGKYGDIRRIDKNFFNNFYEPGLIDFVSLLYCNDPSKRPTAVKALGFLKQLLSNPNSFVMYNQIKFNLNGIFKRVNNGFRIFDKGVINQNVSEQEEEFIQPEKGKKT